MRCLQTVVSSCIVVGLTVAAGCSKVEETATNAVPPTPVSQATPVPAAAPANNGGYGDAYNGGEAQVEYKGPNASYGDSYGTSTDAEYKGTDSGYGDTTVSNDSNYGGSSSGYGEATIKYDPPLTLIAAAGKAFDQGNTELAVRFAKAAAFVAPADRASVAEAVRWSSTSQQPELISQVAVGITVDAPDGLTEYNPIYTTEASAATSDASGYGSDPYGSGYGAPAPKARVSEKKKNAAVVSYTDRSSQYFSTELEKAAGLMASELILFMNAEHKSGTWAPLFAEKEVAYTEPKSSGGSGGGGYGDSYGSDYGSSYGGSDYGGSTQILPAKDDPLVAKLKEPTNPRVAAELVYIGSGKLPELVKRAKEAGIPALVIFECEVKANRRINFIMHECQAKLIHVDSGKPVGTSKKLENRDVAERYADGDKDVVKDAMNLVLEKLKAAVALKEMPTALTPELIKSKRLPNLVSDESRDKLDRLFEVLLWHERKLLSDQDYQSACESILGQTGSTLANGTEEERMKIVIDLI